MGLHAVKLISWHTITFQRLISLGMPLSSASQSTVQSKPSIETLSSANLSELLRAVSITHGSGLLPYTFSIDNQPLITSGRNVFEAIEFLGVIHFAATYPAIGLLVKFLQTIMPSFSAKQTAHLTFTEARG